MYLFLENSIPWRLEMHTLSGIEDSRCSFLSLYGNEGIAYPLSGSKNTPASKGHNQTDMIIINSIYALQVSGMYRNVAWWHISLGNSLQYMQFMLDNFNMIKSKHSNSLECMFLLVFANRLSYFNLSMDFSTSLRYVAVC